MSDNDEQTERENHASIWQNGKSIGTLPPSPQNMEQVRKDIIKFALGFEIKDIRTYSGYRGDLLVEITAMDIDVITKIKEWAENLGMETALKNNSMTMVYELFCITPDENVYGLAQPKQ